MKLFKMDVTRGSEGREIIAHFETQELAVRHVEKKFAKWTISNVREIRRPAHFQIADFEIE